MADKKSSADKLFSAGTEAVGAASGGVVGAILGGPIGAAAGGVLGVALTHLLEDFASRMLSQRETVKLGTTSRYAVLKIDERLKLGEQPRDDGFFSAQTGERSAAEELFEGVLHASRREHEEKKLRLLGSFMAALAFTPGIRRGEANHLLRLAEALTYRQMCVLGLLKMKEDGRSFSLADVCINAAKPQSLDSETLSLLEETHELCSAGLAYMVKPGDTAYTIAFGFTEIVPAHLELSVTGRRLALLLDVAGIPMSDIDPVVGHLSSFGP